MSEPTTNVNATLLRIETLLAQLEEGSVDLTTVQAQLTDILNVLESIYGNTYDIQQHTYDTVQGMGYKVLGGTLAEQLLTIGVVVTNIRDSVGTGLRALVDNIRSTALNIYAALAPIHGTLQNISVNLGSEDTSPGPNVYTLLQQIRDELAQLPKCPCEANLNSPPNELECDEPIYLNGFGIVSSGMSPHAGRYYVDFAQVPEGWQTGLGEDGLPVRASIYRDTWPAQGVKIYVSSKDEVFIASPQPEIILETNRWVDIGDMGQQELTIITRNHPARAVLCLGEPDDPENPNPRNYTGSNYMPVSHAENNERSTLVLFDSVGATSTMLPLPSTIPKPRVFAVLWCGVPLGGMSARLERRLDNGTVLATYELEAGIPRTILDSSYTEYWYVVTSPTGGSEVTGRFVWAYHEEDTLERCELA